MNRAEARTRLREMALQVIGTADRMLAAVERGVEPAGVYDCEAWHLKRHFARRILNAVETGGRVDPAWMTAIGRAAAGPVYSSSGSDGG